jgi:hypothetical protein
MAVGEQDIMIDVNPALSAGIKAILQDSQGKFPRVFEGGLTEPRYYYEADYSTFYASSQVEEADLERGIVAAGGNNRPDTRTLSLAMAVPS